MKKPFANRARRYLAQERRAAAHPNAIAVHRRPRRVKPTIVKRYLQIDRGVEA